MNTILLAHNYYQQPGGEDQVVEAEARLLAEHGHRVLRYEVHNDAVPTLGAWRLAGRTLWSREDYRQVQALVRRERVDVVHVHNTLPLLSPAVYAAARRAGAAVVQTLHNYRLLCPNALLYREGRVCTACAGRHVPWPSVAHACYRGSRPASAVVASMLSLHRALGTYTRQVDAYIALTAFGRAQFEAAGLPAARLYVKPNFLLDDPGPGDGAGGYALFVGRLSEEKGITTLLEAWRAGAPMPLRIVGDGPLRDEVAAASREIDGVTWLGHMPLAEIYEHFRSAALLVFPSVWYEGMGRTIMEAYACGTPVVASNLGAMQSLVRDGETGFHFAPGDACDLLAALGRFVAAPDPGALRAAARAAFEEQFTADKNYEQLVAVYARALEHRRLHPPS